MSAQDKFEASMDKAKGKVKEAVGHATDNEKLVAEGKLDQVKGSTKGAVADVKDAARDVKDAATDDDHK